MRQDISKEIKVPEGISAEVNGSKVVVSGNLGRIEKDFPHDAVSIEKRDSSIIVTAKRATKREKEVVGTIVALVKNMISGVAEAFKYELQICSVHFPISAGISPDKKFVVIKNFLGEQKERKAEILDNVDVKIENEIITVKSVDKEAVSHTAANIEMATRIKAKDRRVFQDGIFMIEKAGKKI